MKDSYQINSNTNSENHPSLIPERGAHFIMTHGNKILWGLILLLLLFVAISRFSSNRMIHAQNDFLQAEYYASVLQDSNQMDEHKKAMDKLQEILSRRKDLQEKYFGVLAQTYLNESNGQKAELFAKKTFLSLEEKSLPFYKAYAETSLLIGENKLDMALERAKNLKELLIAKQEADKNDSYPLLFGFNLIRIAYLHQSLHQQSEELHAWEEVETYLNNIQASEANSKTTPSPQALISKHFQEGEISFKRYIEERKKSLTL